MVIESFPLLSQKGAYARRAIYPPVNFLLAIFNY